MADTVAVPADPDYTDILNDILHLVKKLKRSCPGIHVPEGFVEEVQLTMVDLHRLLKVVRSKEDNLTEKAVTIHEDVKRLDKPCPGPHIPEKTMHHIHKLMTDIEQLLSNYSTSNTELSVYLKERLKSLKDLIVEIRGDHNEIIQAIKGIDVKCQGPHVPEEFVQSSHAMLIEILSLLQDRKVEVTEYLEPEPQVNITAVCRCSDIVAKAKVNAKFSTQGFTPGLCQQCVNDHRGREFIKNLSIPVLKSVHFINLVGYLIQAIMDDDKQRFDALMRLFHKMTPDWKTEEYQIFLEALLHLSLIWDRQICAQHLVMKIDVPAMFIKIKENKKVFNICDFLKSAAGAQNPEVLVTLLNGLTDKQKVVVINSPSIYQEQKTFPIFEAARRGDVKCFEILAQQGAEFDLLEKGRTIVHELVRLSGKKLQSRHKDDWQVAIGKMLDSIYENASRWWERHQGKSEYDKGSSASRKSALQYLFWHCTEKKTGMSIIEYAGAYGADYVMKKIMSNIPYHFLPDPFEPGYYTGEEGYVVDDVDSNTQDGLCVLDYIIKRKPEEAGPILKIEPFYSLIEDKWLHYKPFYFIMFIAYIVYMFIYTVCAFNRPPLSEKTFNEMHTTGRDWARFVGELVCLICLPVFLYGEIRQCCKRRFQRSSIWDWFGVFRLLNILFVIFTVIALILRCIRNENEDIILAIGVLLGWFNATVFLGAWRSTGFLPITLHMAWFQDVLPRFIPLYVLILLATSTSTFIVFQGAVPIVSQHTNESYFYTPFTLFKMTFALEDADFVGYSREPSIGIILFVVHVIIAIVLIFYLLLSMMADTYRRMHKVLDSNWVWVRANFVLYLEARLPASFYISYNRRQRQRLFKGMAKTKLKYVKKVERRRNQNGHIAQVEQHAVLLKRDDPPIPEPAPLKLPPPDVASVKAPPPKHGTLPPTPDDGAIIDMTGNIPTLRTMKLGTYETLPDPTEPPAVQPAVQPEQEDGGQSPTPKTYVHGKGNKVNTSNAWQ